MTLKELVIAFRHRCGDESVQARVIETLAREGGLERFAEMMAESEHAGELQRIDTDIAVDGEGVAAVPSDMLTGYITRVAHPNVDQELELVESRKDLAYTFNDEFGYAAVENGMIYTKPPASYGAVLTGEIEVTGIFIPTLAQVPDKRRSILLDVMLEMYAESLKMNRPGRDVKREKASPVQGAQAVETRQ